jgi:hypothetical protein
MIQGMCQWTILKRADAATQKSHFLFSPFPCKELFDGRSFVRKGLIFLCPQK